jgi:hypothetical protein
LLLAVSHSAARTVAIHPRTRRSASICHLSNHVQFGSQAFSSIAIDHFGGRKLWLPLPFSLQKLVPRLCLPQQMFGIALTVSVKIVGMFCDAALVGTDH